MPVLPQSLLVLGASFKTAGATRRLRRTNGAVPAQQRTFRALIEKLAATSVGRDSGVEAGMSYETFRSRVPARSYDDLASAIARMKEGEANVLWPGRCSFFALSAGTTDGRSKCLPVTAEMLAHFRRAGLAALLFYTARVGHSGVFRGRHLFLGGSTALNPIATAGAAPAYVGGVSGLASLNLPRWAERHLCEPGAAITQIDDWTKRTEAIIARTRHLDLTLVAGLPPWLLQFAHALLDACADDPQRSDTLQALWPNLECIVHGGVPLAPFQDQLRQAVGPAAQFHEVYAAAEGLIAAQDGEAGRGLRLLAEEGLFFEFLPLRDYEAASSAGIGSRALPLEGVRTGEDYVVLLTTPAGLCRYVLGDVVRFLSVAPPRLQYVGRTALQLNALGERVQEADITHALVAVCRRHHWPIVNFHVAPLFTSSLTGQTRGCHEWWVELQPLSVETPTGPILAAELDAELMTLNADYKAKRHGNTLTPPMVRLVMPGFFAHWLKHHQKWDASHKMPRCRSDRIVADELSAMACFNA